jgi:hypothetical protein
MPVAQSPAADADRVRQHTARGKPLMDWLKNFWHRSSVLRLAVRGVVLALTAWPLMVLALELQPQMAVLSPPMAIVAVTGFVLIESALFIAIKLVFRKLT